MVYLFAPQYGVEIYGPRICSGQRWGYNLTFQELFYLLNLLLKFLNDSSGDLPHDHPSQPICFQSEPNRPFL